MLKDSYNSFRSIHTAVLTKVRTTRYDINYFRFGAARHMNFFHTIETKQTTTNSRGWWAPWTKGTATVRVVSLFMTIYVLIPTMMYMIILLEVAFLNVLFVPYCSRLVKRTHMLLCICLQYIWQTFACFNVFLPVDFQTVESWFL